MIIQLEPVEITASCSQKNENKNKNTQRQSQRLSSDNKLRLPLVNKKSLGSSETQELLTLFSYKHIFIEMSDPLKTIMLISTTFYTLFPEKKKKKSQLLHSN